MLDLFTLFSEHHSPIAMPEARQRSMRPAHMSRLAASPLTDIANLRYRKRLRQSLGNGCGLLRRDIFDAHEESIEEGIQ